ncbi:MAG: prepilin-type N-terminal cleavage/methylation domain-containing protein [Planctomycetes bacterium]|nr:prepilin-type N-terminal cleavage/methylation domain-containing protein [Planctomycetota bacterium]
MIPQSVTRTPGFTLIELMVVIAIIVLAAGLMTPTITDFFRNRQLESVRGQFGAAFNDARLRAVNQGRPVSLVFFREGVRIYDERLRAFLDDDTFNPETAALADEKVWFELGFHRKLPSTALRPYRQWAKAQEALREPAASGGGRGSVLTFNVEGLPRIRFERDGSLTFVTGTDVGTTFFKEAIPSQADIVIRQTMNATACFIDLRAPGQMRSKMVPTGEIAARPTPSDLGTTEVEGGGDGGE